MSKQDRDGVALRWLAAVIVALAGAAAIWVITPLNDLVFNSPYISDSYLPVAGLFFLLVLVLGVNPLLRRLRPAWAFSSRQMALVFALVLVASVVPGQGLMRILPQAIVKVPRAVREDRSLAEAYERMRLPPSLFPDRVGFGGKTPVSDAFLTELRPGEDIPWAQWLPPLLSWGLFLVFAWLMTVGLSLIVYPQWRHAERLAFPLLTVQHALLEDPPPGRLFGGVLRDRSFWVAVGAVGFLHLLSGLAKYYPDAVPAVPLSFSIAPLLTEEPFRHLPWWVEGGRIYFILVGAAFFMPNRTGFSVWFFAIAYALYEMVGRAYLPPYHDQTVSDHRTGAMVTLGLVILWLGRYQWARVFRCAVRPAAGPEDRRDRTAAWMFTAGCAGMLGWMVWIGVDWPWAVCFTGFSFMTTLLIARLVAETGMPFVRIDVGGSMALLKIWPVTWFGPATLWFSQVVVALFTFASRVSAGVMATHGLGMDENATPRQQVRLAWLFVPVLVLGVVVSGAATLRADYRHTSSLDGARTPLSPGGTAILDGVGSDLVRQAAALDRGRADPLVRPPYPQFAHLGFGAGLALALALACLALPRWPLHPIGLIIAGSIYSNLAWFSILLGWLIKVLLVHYGGAGLYRRARPFFIGLIVGEVIAAVLWFIVPVAIIAAGGQSYLKIDVVPQ